MNHNQDIHPASGADDIGLGENWCFLSDIEDLNAKVAGPSSYTFTAVSDSYVPPLGDTQIPVDTLALDFENDYTWSLAAPSVLSDKADASPVLCDRKLVTDCIVGNVDPLFL